MEKDGRTANSDSTADLDFRVDTEDVDFYERTAYSDFHVDIDDSDSSVGADDVDCYGQTAYSESFGTCWDEFQFHTVTECC